MKTEINHHEQVRLSVPLRVGQRCTASQWTRQERYTTDRIARGIANSARRVTKRSAILPRESKSESCSINTYVIRHRTDKSRSQEIIMYTHHVQLFRLSHHAPTPLQPLPPPFPGPSSRPWRDHIVPEKAFSGINGCRSAKYLGT